jgi:hypothetical protein
MLSSIPNFFCCITKPFRNKVTLKNESEFKVKYEAYIYKGSSIGKVDAALGGGGFEGKTALEIIQAEALKKEVGYIPANGTRYVTCGYGGKIAVRYMFEDLHHDYTDELRNFEVLDVVQFLQPSTKDVERIHKVDEEERKAQRIEEEKERKVRQIEEEKEREAHRIEEERKARQIEENRRRMCSSKFGHMCSAPDTPKQQCWKCHDWYCNYHFARNNNPFGKGGHICN